MKKFFFYLSGLALVAASSATAASGSKEAQRPATLRAQNPDMSLTFEGKFIAGWVLGAPEKVDFEDLSDLTNGKPGTLCIVSERKKACHPLNPGEVGAYVVKYLGKTYPARLKI
jgi:hypothetical protein